MWIRRCRKVVRRAWRRWPSGLGGGADGPEFCQDGPVVASAVPGGHGQPGPASLPRPARSARIRATIASAGGGRAHGWSILPGAATLTNGTAAGRPCPAWHPPFVITTLVVLVAPFVVLTNPPGDLRRGWPAPGKPVADRPPRTSRRGRARQLSQGAVARPGRGRATAQHCGGAAYLVMWMTRSMPSVVCSRLSWVSNKQASTQKPGLTWTTCCSKAPWVKTLTNVAKPVARCCAWPFLPSFSSLAIFCAPARLAPRAATIMWTRNPSLPNRTRSPLCRMPGPRKLNSIEDILACGAGSLAGEEDLVILNVVNGGVEDDDPRSTAT